MMHQNRTQSRSVEPFTRESVYAAICNMARHMGWLCVPIYEDWPTPMWGIQRYVDGGYQDIWNVDQLSAVLGLPGYDLALPVTHKMETLIPGKVAPGAWSSPDGGKPNA
jgi:hypothetical protein